MAEEDFGGSLMMDDRPPTPDAIEALPGRAAKTSETLREIISPKTPPALTGPTPEKAQQERIENLYRSKEDKQQEQIDLERQRLEVESQRQQQQQLQVEQQRQQDLLQRQDRALTRFEGAQDEAERLRQQQAQERAPIIADTQRRMAQPLPQRPQLKIPPQVPDLVHAGQEWVGAAFIFSALAGALVRGNSTAALTAMGGVLDGFAKGNEAMIKTAWEQWDRENTRALEMNKIKLDDYKNAMEARDRPIEQNLEMMKLISLKYQDLMPDVKSFSEAASLYDRMVDSHYKLEQSHLNMKLKEAQLAKAIQEQAEKQQAVMDDDQADQMAERVLSGDPTALTSIGGRGRERQINLNKINAQINAKIKERGLSSSAVRDAVAQFRAMASGMTSQARAAGTRAGQLRIVGNVLDQSLDAAAQASQALPRTQMRAFNSAVQAGQRQFSDTRLTDLTTQLVNVAESWARAMNPSGVMREGDRNLALQVLTSTQSHESLMHVLAGIKQYVNREQIAVEKALQEGPGGKNYGLVAAPLADLPSALRSIGVSTQQPPFTVRGAVPSGILPKQQNYNKGDIIPRGGKRYRALTDGPDPEVEEVK